MYNAFDPTGYTANKLPDFMKQWTETGSAAMSAGDLAAVLPLLRAAKEFEAEFYPEVALAQSRLTALEAGLASLVVSAQSIAKEHADPAVAVLIDWYKLLGLEMTPKLAKDLKPLLESKLDKEWAKAVSACLRWKNVMSRSDADPAAAANELLATLGGFEGRLPRELAAELKRASEAKDSKAFEALVLGAEFRPRTWLAQTHFGWTLPAAGRGH